MTKEFNNRIKEQNSRLQGFLFWSFYYSQGGLNLQKAFLDEYLKGKGLLLFNEELYAKKVGIIQDMNAHREFITNLHGADLLAVDPHFSASGVPEMTLQLGSWDEMLTDLVGHINLVPDSTDADFHKRLIVAADALLKQDMAHVDKVKSRQPKNVRMLGKGDQKLANLFFLRYGLRSGRTYDPAITTVYRNITQMLNLPDTQLDEGLVVTREKFVRTILTNQSRFLEEDYVALCDWIRQVHDD